MARAAVSPAQTVREVRLHSKYLSGAFCGDREFNFVHSGKFEFLKSYLLSEFFICRVKKVGRIGGKGRAPALCLRRVAPEFGDLVCRGRPRPRLLYVCAFEMDLEWPTVNELGSFFLILFLLVA